MAAAETDLMRIKFRIRIHALTKCEHLRLELGK